MIEIFAALSTAIWLAWCWSGIFMDLAKMSAKLRSGSPVYRRVFFELKPFALPAIFGMHIEGVRSIGAGWQTFWTALNVLCWLVARNKKDDDDRWKRRGKKLAEKIERQGARLVVVPAGSSNG